MDRVKSFIEQLERQRYWEDRIGEMLDTRPYIKMSDELVARGFSIIAFMPHIRFIYQLEAGGLRYIGQSIDPYKRFGEHLCGPSGCSSEQVVGAAMKSGTIPQMTIIDICHVASVISVEAFWINKRKCVNRTTSPRGLKKILKHPEQFQSIMAAIALRQKPTEFQELLQAIREGLRAGQQAWGQVALDRRSTGGTIPKLMGGNELLEKWKVELGISP